MRSVFRVAALVATAACTPAPTPPPPATPPTTSMPPSTPPSTPPASPDTLPIVQTGATVLRSRAQELPPERMKTPWFDDLVKRMIATMRAAPGVGLAAPQIGIPFRVIVLEDREELASKLSTTERTERERVPFPTRVFVNPELTSMGKDSAMFFEGCLSVKGYVALVERSLEVEVKGLDEHGTPQTWRVRGWPARILQHEVDHLDGTLYIDRMKSRSFGTAEQAKELYGGKPIAEIRRMLGL